MPKRPEKATVTPIDTVLQAASSASTETVDNDIVHEGWLLKKKRKKMQGYARRYFILKNDGTLSYSVQKGDPIRDQIFLNYAAFSSSPTNRSIHIDSGTSTFHTRALTVEDYQLWMSALRRFIATPRVFNESEPNFRRSVGPRTVSFSVSHATKMNAVLDDMGKSIEKLQGISNALKDQDIKPTGSTRSKKDHSKEGSKETGFLGIFHRHKAASKSPTTSEVEDPDKTRPSSPTTSEGPPPTLQGVLQELQLLEQQHKSLLASFNALLHLDTISDAPKTMSPIFATPIEWQETLRANSRLGGRRTMSIETTSEGSLQWFDASDGPEEYVIDEAEVAEPVVVTDHESDSEEEKGYETPGAENEEVVRPPVKRRTHLPARDFGDEMSLLNVLRKNVGKDLSTIALPVGFNEPISILQRLAEDLEYSELLDQAAKTEDEIQRLCLIGAFAVSGYSCTRLRAARKPFNPMLGETFEDIRFNFIAEKVCHVPPVMACHASGDGWTYDSVTQAKQKFWGRSLEIIPVGTTSITLFGQTYSWQKPSSFMRNIVAGTKYLEHVGTMLIKNETDGSRCEIEFKEAGLWGSPNIINASVYSSRGKLECKLEGKWHEQVSRIISRMQLEVLWRANELPPHASDYYGFTYFTMSLNEITDDLKVISEDGSVEGYLIPCTDSRFRPDQRAQEEGKLDEADDIKVKVEEMQRLRRRAGKDVTPRWFTKVGDGDTDWVYKGNYWETRAQGWGKQESLW